MKAQLKLQNPLACCRQLISGISFLMLLLLKQTLYAQTIPAVNYTFHKHNSINLGTVSPLPFGNLYLIATISSPYHRNSESGFDYIHRLFISVNYSDNLLWNTNPVKIWVVAHEFAGNMNWHDNTPAYEGFIGESEGGDIAPCIDDLNNGDNHVYYVYAEILTRPDQSHCGHISFTFKTRWKNLGSGFQTDQTTTMYYSNYATNWTEWNTPDLFIKDNHFDKGQQPNWNDVAEITKSSSILNTLTPSGSGLGIYFDELNPSLSKSNFAQRSTQGQLNEMKVLVQNRGCVNTTQTARLNVFWTVARVWEPWGSNWFNYHEYDGFAANNYTLYANPNTSTIEQVEMGNHITLQDPWDYRSAEQKVTIPAGVAPPNFNNTGGYLAKINWNPPHRDWYLGASNIFINNNANPVFCYLAMIEEPNKPQNGMHTNYAKESNASITNLALYNNNVATVNSYLATPDGFYKNFTGGNYRSDPGVIMVEQQDTNPVQLSIVYGQNGDMFAQHGSVYAIFDEVLWDVWGNSGFEGSGFQVVSPQVVRITNPQVATFRNLNLEEGQRGMIGIQFEYNANNVPDSDYVFGLSLGAYDTDSLTQTGAPTHYVTDVLHTPQLAPDTGIVETTITMGIRKNELETLTDFMNVYPNPATTHLNIGFRLLNNADMIKLEVFDMRGSLVYETAHQSVKAGSQNMRVPTENLVQGNYLLKIYIDGKYQTRNFVKN